MKKISKSNIIVLSGAIITFYLLQLFSFPRSSNIILLIGALKIVVILFCLIYTFIKIRPLINTLLLILIQIILVYGSFHLSLWKITGAVYLKHNETQYLEILDVLKREKAFTVIIYRENGDSVKIFSNGKDTPLFSDYDKERIIKFMKNTISSNFTGQNMGSLLFITGLLIIWEVLFTAKIR